MFIAFIQHYAKDVLDYDIWATVYLQAWPDFWPVFGPPCYWDVVAYMSHLLWGIDWRPREDCFNFPNLCSILFRSRKHFFKLLIACENVFLSSEKCRNFLCVKQH